MRAKRDDADGWHLAGTMCYCYSKQFKHSNSLIPRNLGKGAQLLCLRYSCGQGSTERLSHCPGKEVAGRKKGVGRGKGHEEERREVAMLVRS